jgi:hypothetical protein
MPWSMISGQRSMLPGWLKWRTLRSDMTTVSIFTGYILVKTKTLYVMVAEQSVFPIFMYLTIGFQIGIFIH